MRAIRHFLWVLAAALFASWSVQALAGPFKLVEGRKNVGIVIMDEIFIVEWVAPLDTYKHAGDKYNVFSVAPTTNPIVGYYGEVVKPDYSFANAPKIDVIVVASYAGSISDALPDRKFSGDLDWLNKTRTTFGKDLINFVKERGKQAEMVTSHCWGAFTLAAAGFLDGKEATTFKGAKDEYINLLGEAFPKVKIRKDKRYVEVGNVVTSQGGLGAFEASLRVVERMFGSELASNIARDMVYDGGNVRNVSAKLKKQ
jgi:transcriptional regulator GlxA family with amidase domain